MSSVAEVGLSVTKTINLGNYESVKIEVSAKVTRDDDTDTPESMRKHLIDEVYEMMDQAKADFVPKRRGKED